MPLPSKEISDIVIIDAFFFKIFVLFYNIPYRPFLVSIGQKIKLMFDLSDVMIVVKNDIINSLNV